MRAARTDQGGARNDGMASALESFLPAVTHGPNETQALGERLAAHLRPGDVVTLTGDLGAGKTQLVKGMALGLGVDPETVTSPTFTLVQEYGAPEPTLMHLDLYRLQREEELRALDLDDLLMRDAVVVIEWPALAEVLLPPETIRLHLEHGGGDTRRITRVNGEP